MSKVRRGVVARVAVTLVVMAGALVAGCHVEEQSANPILDKINKECTHRLSERQGDDAVDACDAAVDVAIKKYGDDFEMKWHEKEDLWTFSGAE